MARFLILLPALLFLSITVSFAQHHHGDDAHFADKYCGSNEALERLLNEHPEYAPIIEEANADLERFTESFDESLYARSNDYIIPVVFHVIHADGNENISDAQIHDAIEVMSEDFTLENEDITGIVEEFADIVADVGVEFRLAKLDPNGNCTNGIVRTESGATFEGGENLKTVSQPWPRGSYLNIWVAADLSGGAAGYTYTPGSVDGFWGAQTDGIVIKHSYVGSIGTGSPTRSRALTHEVGHWINLRHPWGGSNNPGLEENCQSDDNVADTPNTIGWTSCTLLGESCGSLDNVQNFMEYSYCSRMFTQGQKNRMLAALNSSTASRNNLHTADNLTATGVMLPGELCSVDIGVNTKEICVGDSVVYTDYSYHNVATRNWTFEGGTPATSNGQEVVVYYNSPGTYNVELEIEDNFGESISESFQNYVKVWPMEGLPLDYSEDFENTTSLEEEWTVPYVGTTHEWQLSTQVSGASGDHALFLPNRSLNEGDVSEVWSQPIDLSNTNTDVTISFKYAYARRNSGNNEKLMFWVSNNCGETWSLREILSNSFETAPFTNAYWFPSSASHWETVVVDNISPSYLVSNFKFKFVFQSDDGNNIFIDDINISGPDATSIDDMDISNNLTVFPNPASNQINLSLSGDKGYSFDLRLINSLGQTVMSESSLRFTGGIAQYSLDTGALSPGVYMLSVETSEGKRAMKRVMLIR